MSTQPNEAKPSPLQQLAAIGARFHGVDLSFRRGGTDWPGAWRARLHASKNERDDYRLEAFGDSPEAAIEALADAVNRIASSQG